VVPLGVLSRSVGKSFEDVIRYSSLESGGLSGSQITKDTLIRLADNINSVSNVTKAISIFKYHTLVSDNGNVLATDVPTAEGWAQAIGFKPEETKYIDNLFSYAKGNKAVVDDAVKVLQNYRNRFATEPDNRDDIGAEINAFMQTLPIEVRIKALREVSTRTPRAVYQSLSDQIKRDQQQKQIIQQMQDQNQ
jgi:hypothetical protein